LNALQPGHRALTRAGVATAYITSALHRKRALVRAGAATACITSALRHKQAWVESHRVDASSAAGGALNARQPGHRAVTRAGVATAYITSTLHRKHALVECHHVSACRGGNGVYYVSVAPRACLGGSHYVESHLSGITAVPLGRALQDGIWEAQNASTPGLRHITCEGTCVGHRGVELWCTEWCRGVQEGDPWCTER
jgi:hypothetical protein